jgi:FkbM family methyltransferase
MGKYTVSYAQNREDIIIKGFFPDIEKGFYLDIGANHPVDDSVTKLFYDLGWAGINVEPNTALFEELKKHRKRDINVNVGLAAEEGVLVLREYANHGLSTFSNEMKEGYEDSHSEKTATYDDVEIKVTTLDSLLSSKAPKNHIHFMKVDVEGYEYEVLSGNDWSKFRPELICIEANHVLKDWRPLLDKAKYTKVFNDGLNDYYLAKESLHREKMFDYASTILVDPPIVNPNIFDKLQRLEHALEVMENQNREIAHLRMSRDELFVQLTRFNGVKAQIRSLITEIYARLIIKIQNIGKFKPLIKAPVFSMNTLSGNELQAAISKYDEKAFDQKRTIGGGIGRLISVALLRLIKLLTASLKLIVHAMRQVRRSVH